MNTRVLTLFFFVSLFCALALAGPARAQDIPADIPDGSGESPADRQRALLTERHRSLISRLFTGSSAAVAPPLNTDLAAFSVQVEAGLNLARGSAIYGTLGMRQFPLRSGPDARGGQRRRARERVLTFALGYDLGLQRLTGGSAFARRSALGFGAGGTLGRISALTLALTPKYTLPVNAYWSLPVGLKLGYAVLGDRQSRVQQTFVGVSLGIKLHHYGHRPQLK